jgi:hypothetical protein
MARLISGKLVSEITPGMMRAIRKGIDPVQHDTHSLPPRRNLWGDAVMLPSGFGLDWISPVYQSIKKNDPTGDEIVRICSVPSLDCHSL